MINIAAVAVRAIGDTYFLVFTKHITRTFDLYKLALALVDIPEQEIGHSGTALGIVFAEELAYSGERRSFEALDRR